jgi:FdrA protein
VSAQAVQTLVRPNTYLDSLTLLRVSSTVAALPGVLDASLVMGTPLNQEVLRDSGLLADSLSAGPNDLVLAVRAEDAAAAEAALQEAERLLVADRGRRGEDGTSPEEPPRSLRGAHRRAPDANLAVISVPGPFAAAQAHQALADGLHVFLFSDNVPLQDEIDLKQRASAAGLLLMGPDCGTSIVNGVGLGFANVVRRGNVGLVGASGTGLQEVSVLLHQAGLGVSSAIGTGSRDLHAQVGGLTTLHALRLLADDPATTSIVLVSKPPAAEVAQRVLDAAAESGKPVVACLLGVELTPPAGVRLARTLAEAAALAADQSPPPAAMPAPAAASGWMVVGLFCGGTLAQEADLVLGEVPHTLTDFGDDRYTQGRLHPMLDPTLRNQAILDAAARPEVRVLLLDVVLGHGAHPDPAGVVAPVIRQALHNRPELRVLVHLLGTDLDPQPLASQAEQLRAAGAELYPSNAAAAHAALSANTLPSI